MPRFSFIDINTLSFICWFMLILIRSHPEAVTHILKLLGEDFHFKDLDELHYFSSIQCHYTSLGLMLSQQKYIADLLTKTNMSTCKPVSSSLSPLTKLFAFDSTSMEDLTLYWSVVGSLQHLLVTWPDITLFVNKVCQFMHASYLTHWQSVKHIPRYLKHIIEHGLLISPSSTLTLVAFFDADWPS